MNQNQINNQRLNQNLINQDMKPSEESKNGSTNPRSASGLFEPSPFPNHASLATRGSNTNQNSADPNPRTR